MWMVGYNNDGADFSNVADHSLINGSRKLRPLIPRPMISSTATTPCLNRIHHHNADFFPQYNHHNLVADHGKKEFNTSPVVVSSRWNPTPEQLSALEELYRRGTRTPSAEQIQHITAQLRRFGKIEGKNVFYWFQNHKARERQKRRRQMESAAEAGHPRDFDTVEKKDFGASRTVFEAEQTKNWAISTNCTSTLAEKYISIQGAIKATVPERTDGWNQFNEEEFQQRRNLIERNDTWHAMQHLSCPPPTAPTVASTTSVATTTTVTATAMEPKLIKAPDLSFFIASHIENGNIVDINSITSEEDDCVESQTLQLFPLRSEDDSDNINQKEAEISVSAMNANLTPCQFFEFLPLKN